MAPLFCSAFAFWRISVHRRRKSVCVLSRVGAVATSFGQTTSIAPAMLCWNGVNPGWFLSSPAESGPGEAATTNNASATNANELRVWSLTVTPPWCRPATG